MSRICGVLDEPHIDRQHSIAWFRAGPSDFVRPESEGRHWNSVANRDKSLVARYFDSGAGQATCWRQWTANAQPASTSILGFCFAYLQTLERKYYYIEKNGGSKKQQRITNPRGNMIKTLHHGFTVFIT